jgi:exo-beta-1,3-glucanase (GH17 family)/cellulose synthase/poly-beta-1,6-N-acetylglucosamine synthase-like glycosyltransferase
MSNLLRFDRAAALIVVVCLNLVGWWWINRPVEEANWIGAVRGVSFHPFQPGQNPIHGPMPTEQDIDRDLRIVAERVGSIRTYGAFDTLGDIPRLAKPYGLRVTAGAWLQDDPARNEREIAALIQLVKENPNIDRVIVGNEAMLRGNLTVAEMTHYIDRVRAAVRVPVSTAEPWHIWVKNPELAQSVDFIAVHILPYWEGVPITHAMAFVKERYNDLKQAFPGKKIVFGEVGWPSDGPAFRQAVPGRTNQAIFLRRFLNWAEDNLIDYFVIEAFDQPWKLTEEGTVGAYWGIFNSDRQPKFSMQGPVIAISDWPRLALGSTVLALIPMLLFLRLESGLRFSGLIAYSALIQAMTSVGMAAVYVLSAKYTTPLTGITWAVLTAALVLVALIVLAEGLELANVLWRRRLARGFPVAARAAPATWPMVSIHVPAYNEPPSMVIETLNALAALDYPNFEVILVDNNTKDPAVWKPLEEHCAKLGPRFRFFHLDHCPGFKAGALNFALDQTNPAAEIIGVIDSDYAVRRHWLRNLVPYFGDARVGFVQAPQDYRDRDGSIFKRMCYWEYAGFFQIGMVERNERNAIIQHGTMTLIRKTALEEVGRWGEWCITEDAELGLRILKSRFDSIYIKHSFGRGVMPDNFTGYKRQRFRWAYGSVQIVKRHARSLFRSSPGGLTLTQRYHFLAGWFPWAADALNVLFTLLALSWTIPLVLWPRSTEFPLPMFLFATVALTGFKTLKSLLEYGARVRCGFLDTLGAAIAGLALSHTVGKAVIFGLFTSNQPFMRTPKLENAPAAIQALAMAWEEALLMLALWAAIGLIVATHTLQAPESVLWVIVLGLQSLPYVAAVAMASINAIGSVRRRSQVRPGSFWQKRRAKDDVQRAEV